MAASPTTDLLKLEIDRLWAIALDPAQPFSARIAAAARAVELSVVLKALLDQEQKAVELIPPATLGAYAGPAVTPTVG